MTLIELLVVAAILAVLAGLLLPAVHAVRETGRRTGCAANQTRLALAFAAFDSRLGYLPGWRNRLQLAPGVKTAAGADHRLASWAVVLLPYIERTDVLNTMLANKMWADANPKEGILLTEYLCPSFKPKTQENAYSVLHYGVNVGTGANRNDGVLVDGTAASRMSLEDVREGDGLDQTMLVSEGAFDDKDWSWGPGWHFRGSSGRSPTASRTSSFAATGISTRSNTIRRRIACPATARAGPWETTGTT